MDMIKELNIDINNPVDTIECLMCYAIIQEGTEVTSRILKRYREYKKEVYQ